MTNTPQFQPYATTREQRVHAKRTNRYDSSDSDDTNTDPNCLRQDSKDDEYLVGPGPGGMHFGAATYGSVPYHAGASSGKRYVECTKSKEHSKCIPGGQCAILQPRVI